MFDLVILFLFESIKHLGAKGREREMASSLAAATVSSFHAHGRARRDAPRKDAGSWSWQ